MGRRPSPAWTIPAGVEAERHGQGTTPRRLGLLEAAPVEVDRHGGAPGEGQRLLEPGRAGLLGEHDDGPGEVHLRRVRVRMGERLELVRRQVDDVLGRSGEVVEHELRLDPAESRRLGEEIEDVEVEGVLEARGDQDELAGKAAAQRDRPSTRRIGAVSIQLRDPRTPASWRSEASASRIEVSASARWAEASSSRVAWSSRRWSSSRCRSGACSSARPTICRRASDRAVVKSAVLGAEPVDRPRRLGSRSAIDLRHVRRLLLVVHDDPSVRSAAEAVVSAAIVSCWARASSS